MSVEEEKHSARGSVGAREVRLGRDRTRDFQAFSIYLYTHVAGS
jgi:hypothetical protein